MYSGGLWGLSPPLPRSVKSMVPMGGGGSAPKGAEPESPLEMPHPSLDKFLNTPLVIEIKEFGINRVTVRVD